MSKPKRGAAWIPPTVLSPKPKVIAEEYYDEAGNWVTIYEDGSGITLSRELLEDDRQTGTEEAPARPPETA